MKQEEFDIPRKVDHLAAMLKGGATSSFKAVARPVLLRLPETSLAELDALAELAGKSRNSMATHLIDAAIEEIRSNLDHETLLKLNAATVRNHVAFEAEAGDRENVEG